MLELLKPQHGFFNLKDMWCQKDDARLQYVNKTIQLVTEKLNGGVINSDVFGPDFM